MLLLSTKLKNSLPSNFDFKLRNVAINGVKKGCSGFIQFEGKTIYVNTERLTSRRIYMVRCAAHDKDFIGERNQWADSPERLVTLIKQLLNYPGETQS